MRRRRKGRRRRLATLGGVLAGAAILAALLFSIAAGGSSGGYRVRAIFDDAGNIISGENVEIDGVKVGTVGSVEPTPQAKAAVVLDISDPGFQNFRSDASCTIRPQGLIGEKYVECVPTQPRMEGAPLPPPLRKIQHGEGAGDYLLPVQNTHSPVDPDLLDDIQRLPERQRFTIIINELGAGLAGRGKDLAEVVRRADPALEELDHVLAILAGENHVLAKLASDSARALKPWAAVRGRFADFIAQSNTVARASARHTKALAENLKDFPPFLEQLVPAMERLGRFAEETTPAFRELGQAAPSIDTAFQKLPGFSEGSRRYYESLGSTAKVSGPALVATKPLLKRLKRLGAAGLPFTGNLSELLSSFANTGGLERLMDFIFLGTGASNGYDALGHFLRAEGVPDSTCLKYSVEFTKECYRKLIDSGAQAASVAGAGTGSGHEPEGLVMERTMAVLAGASPQQAIEEFPGSTEGLSGAAAEEAAHAGAAARSVAASSGSGASSASTASAGSAASSGGAGAPAGSGQGAEGRADGMLLNYLLGSE